MDRRDSSKYFTSSTRHPLAGPSNDPAPFPGGWPLQDQSRPLTHTQSSSRPLHPLSPQPPMGYSNHHHLAMPEPFHSQEPMWSPPLPPRQTQPGYSGYGYPPQSTNRDQPAERWHFPEPQIVRSISHKSSLHPPPAHPRARSHSSTGIHPGIETSISSPNLRHKHSHSDTRRPKEWYEEEELNDVFEVSWTYMVDAFLRRCYYTSGLPLLKTTYAMPAMNLGYSDKFID